MERIERALWSCDTFVSIGTSGRVYPAAGFAGIATAADAYCLEINLEASDTASDFDELRAGTASTLVPAWVDAYLAGRSMS